MIINNKAHEEINSATEEKQDLIIAALGLSAKSSDLSGVALAENQLTNAQLVAALVNLATAKKQDDLMGKLSQIVTGVAPTDIKAGYGAYGCTCRVDGSKITSCKKTVAGTEEADATETMLTVALFQGEYQPFEFPITEVTQTGLTDSITYWIKPLTDF